MNYYEDVVRKAEYYRANDRVPASVEVPEAAGDPAGFGTHDTHAEKSEAKDPVVAEREKELELWMESVKAFIRRIDVSSL